MIRAFVISDGFFESPTLRDLTSTAVTIAGAVGSAGLLTPLVSMADDVLFAALDASLGYKDWKNAALDVGKAAAITALEFGTGGLSQAAGKAIESIGTEGTKILLNAGLTAGTAYLNGTASSLINAVDYDSSTGITFDMENAVKNFSSEGTCFLFVISEGCITAIINSPRIL